jgi:AcrR family transcriptional regulator
LRRATRPRLRSASPRRSTERGRQTRQRLLDAAAEIFARKGFFETSVSEITGRAGASQGAFYLYFHSKDEAFFEVLAYHSHLIRQRTGQARVGAPSALEAERRAFEAFFALVVERPEIYRIVRQAEFVDPQRFREHYAPFVDRYSRSLEGAMERGEMRRLDPEALVFCLFGIADFLGMRWPYWTGNPVPARVIETMMGLIRHGLQGPQQPQQRLAMGGPSNGVALRAAKDSSP